MSLQSYISYGRRMRVEKQATMDHTRTTQLCHTLFRPYAALSRLSSEASSVSVDVLSSVTFLSVTPTARSYPPPLTPWQRQADIEQACSLAGREGVPPAARSVSKEMLFYLQALGKEDATKAFHHYRGAYRSVLNLSSLRRMQCCPPQFPPLFPEEWAPAYP